MPNININTTALLTALDNEIDLKQAEITAQRVETNLLQAEIDLLRKKRNIIVGVENLYAQWINL